MNHVLCQARVQLPDLIGWRVTADEPNRKYVVGSIGLPTSDCPNLNCACVIDLGPREIAGWQVTD